MSTMDLEDRILRKNVPGRWSSLEGENDDLRFDDEDGGNVSEEEENNMPLNEEQELLEYVRGLENADVPEPVRRSIIAERERKHNTGVKGVLADYRQSVQMEEAVTQQESLFRQDVLTRIAEGTKRSHFQTPEDDEEDTREDITFMEEYRRKRLLELQATVAMPMFGRCLEVDSTDFVDMVDKEDPRVVVVVHLYEVSVQGCVRLNGQLEELAVRRPHTKFLRMNASANQVSMDRIALPLLTLYRAGEVVATHAALDRELGPRFTVDDVDWLLESDLPLGNSSSSALSNGRSGPCVASSRLAAASDGCVDADEVDVEN